MIPDEARRRLSEHPLVAARLVLGSVLTVGAVPGMPAGRLLMGIGALLPPVILGQYLVRQTPGLTCSGPDTGS